MPTTLDFYYDFSLKAALSEIVSGSDKNGFLKRYGSHTQPCVTATGVASPRATKRGPGQPQASQRDALLLNEFKRETPSERELISRFCAITDVRSATETSAFNSNGGRGFFFSIFFPSSSCVGVCNLSGKKLVYFPSTWVPSHRTAQC